MKAVAVVNEEILFDVMRLWGLELKEIRRDASISGSPDRSEYRVVVESVKGDRFMVEQVFSHTVERKKEIAACLDFLANAGLEAVIPYRKNRQGEQVLPFAERFWQIQDFLPGLQLSRPDYVFDGWRGEVTADFLINLRCFAERLDRGKESPFSLKAYIYRLILDARRHDPIYARRMQTAFNLLECDFFDISDYLPTRFCHGDYHPLNIIWTPHGIGAVIDWEFCGWKAELYDAANMVGCLGIEDPESLVGDFVCRFVEALKKGQMFYRESWKYFYELILAIRFGWMAEWLRKKDLEMVEMELDYWDILMEHKENLKIVWGI